MRFSTAIRQPTRRRLERLGETDILVGIPCFNNEATISHVIKTVEDGLALHYPNRKCIVMVADGGSVDDTREEGDELEASPWIERIISIYRGIPGKGSAVRQIFEAASLAQAKVCVMFDSDLRSITPDWVKCMVDPVLNDSYDYIAPYYKRYKYDGTITNNIVYNLTRALYGYRVRQPIGGDFAFSLPLIQKYIAQDVWETDVARFGIDIWLTTTAMVHKAKCAQANLGVKIHDVKDPAEALGPMFRQVVFTLLSLMQEYENVWKSVRGSKPTPIIGPELNVEPQPFSVNLVKLIEDFKIGYSNYGEVWKKIIAADNWQIIEDLVKKEEKDFLLKTEMWARILYDLAAAFHHWKGNRRLMVRLMTPLYFARVASFVNRTKDMNNEEAEALVEEQAEKFEQAKGYLIQRWDEEVHYYDDITE
ncbi:glycosyltransferase [candidate division KSB1 bacterium]|nr:glycosyltransferase [candidate division KSB1 bacterium]NIR71883.1 glycosyltransferase [candidate division KSB1 bacterium]NIS26450.1 glycosyltransferase [candidate division KSB1 bacterium]NIT73220.1 glycosyltransferase [candidate division KSB1 bacterium]NIU27134.1 glycosyltransferase [candidate division KSB1 bacterium]